MVARDVLELYNIQYDILCIDVAIERAQYIILIIYYYISIKINIKALLIHLLIMELSISQ